MSYYDIMLASCRTEPWSWSYYSTHFYYIEYKPQQNRRPGHGKVFGHHFTCLVQILNPRQSRLADQSDQKVYIVFRQKFGIR